MSETETLRVLLVEDSPFDADVARTVLEQSHTPRFAVDHVTRLGEALARVSAGDYDVVLLDLMLPDSSGVDTFTRLNTAAPNLPVVVLTASEDQVLGASFLSLGVSNYLVKKKVGATALCSVLAFAVKQDRMLAELQGEYDQLNNLIGAVQDGKVDSIIGPGAQSPVYRVEFLELYEENQRLLRELAEASRTKDEFLAKMSHELRTPLNSIIGFTEMMIHDTKDPPVGKRSTRLEKVHRNGQNLLALINDILDISKIEAKQLTLARDTVDISALIAECAGLAEPLVKSGGVELRTRIERSLARQPNWVGDAVRLRQIIMNLLSNAAKFTDQGHIELRASIDGDEMLIEVEDTGISVPTEQLESIFDEFHQADSSATRRASGTGLGLAICRKLSRLMGGEVTVTSQLGRGSCFTVRMPIGRAGLVPGDLSNRPVWLHAGTAASARRISQALPTITQRVRGSGSSLDIPHIEFATAVGEALERCRHQSPALVSVDPFWLDASRLLVELKTSAVGECTPIALFGILDDAAATVGFDDCIAQPLGKDTLHRILRRQSDASPCRVLLFRERRKDNEYLSEMLTEFDDLTINETTSVQESLELVADDRVDAVLVDVLDTQGIGLELAHAIQRDERAECRLLAVIPRDSSHETIVALSRSFELHIARHGEPLDQAVRRLFASLAPLVHPACPEGMVI